MLAVLFTHKGATGFPEPTSTGKQTRQRALRDAQATQVIFHARTQKYVVVLAEDDIKQLDQPGALPKILYAKMRAVEFWTGLPLEFDEEWQEIDLPRHLAQHM